MNYNKGYLFDFLIPFACSYRVCLVIMTHIMSNLQPFQATYSESIFYIQRGEKNTNYAKKVIIFVIMKIKMKINERISPILL